MLDDVKLLNIASAMVRHAATRHTILAENIANADTPDYKARDLEEFSDAYARMSNKFEQRSLGSGDDLPWRVEQTQITGSASPNGNNVSLEEQMVRSADAQQDHEAALAIYKKTIDLMRMTLGRNS